MDGINKPLLWIAVVMLWVFQSFGTAAADVIVLNDGRRIETPRALVEGTEVYYYEGDQVLSLPHAQVREILRGDSSAVPAPEAAGHPINQFYRLVFNDGRAVQIDDYNDVGNVIQYTKYDVRVTLDKSVVRSITRVSEAGEQVAFGRGARPPPAEQSSGEEAALRRMSDESRERAMYNALVDETTMDAEASRIAEQKNAYCLDQCLQVMLACRDTCAEVLDTLKSKQVGEDDPVYIMVHKDVVEPCIRQCIAKESVCRSDCAKKLAASQP